jgi:hypothetical protein
MTQGDIKTRLFALSAECEHGSTSAILEQDAGIDTIESELRGLITEALEALGAVMVIQHEQQAKRPAVELRKIVEWHCGECGEHNQMERFLRTVRCSNCKKEYAGRW